MTTAKAASNGGTATTAKAERKTGLARVQEAEAYHLATLAGDAAFEAERLCHQIQRAASDAYLNNADTITPAADALADPAMQNTIHEAICCLLAALIALCDLDQDGPPS